MAPNLLFIGSFACRSQARQLLQRLRKVSPHKHSPAFSTNRHPMGLVVSFKIAGADLGSSQLPMHGTFYSQSSARRWCQLPLGHRCRLYFGICLVGHLPSLLYPRCLLSLFQNTWLAALPSHPPSSVLNHNEHSKISIGLYSVTIPDPSKGRHWWYSEI